MVVRAAVDPDSEVDSKAIADALSRPHKTLICTAITATSLEDAISELEEASKAGADLAEIRLDYLHKFSAENDLPRLLNSRNLPVIVTYRPRWEGCAHFHLHPAKKCAMISDTNTFNLAILNTKKGRTKYSNTKNCHPSPFSES